MRNFIAILFTLMFSSSLHAQYINKHVREGNKLYKEQKFNEALLEYQKSVQEGATDPVTNFNLGNALYRNSKFDEAAKTFHASAELKRSQELTQKSFYNEGVAMSKQQKLEESIAAYKQAVLLDPADEDARINLQKALIELKKKQPPQQQKQDKKEQNKKEQQQQQPKSNLTKKQVEQLLKALQQREQQVQQKMQQNRNRSAGQQEKDW